MSGASKGGMDLGVSYYGNRIPWRVREDLKAIRDAGCNYVVHTYSEEDHEFYEGAMAEIVADSQKLGLKVWMDPWGIGQVFGGETYSKLVMERLSWRQISSMGEVLPIICPNQQGFREYLLSWINSCVGFKADALFWDEPHFKIYPEPNPTEPAKLWACKCGACQGLYKKLYGEAMPEKQTKQVRQFKEQSLVDFVRFLCEATKAKGLKATVCMLPFENSSTVNDWDKIAALPALDLIGTDPYWQPHQPAIDQHVGRASKRIAELAAKHKKEGQIWILNFNIPKGEESNIRVAIKAATQAGIKNLAAWSYFGASYMKLRAQDPEAVWKTLSACYKELI